MNQPQSLAAAGEIEFGYDPSTDSAEDLDRETLLALEMILDDQIRISWMQDRPAFETGA